jgi:predicted transposase YdaD
MTTGQVQRIYLDELPLDPEQSLGIKMAEMVVAGREAAIEQARQLIQ